MGISEREKIHADEQHGHQQRAPQEIIHHDTILALSRNAFEDNDPGDQSKNMTRPNRLRLAGFYVADMVFPAEIFLLGIYSPEILLLLDLYRIWVQVQKPIKGDKKCSRSTHLPKRPCLPCSWS
jgi:hypothetical protein